MDPKLLTPTTKEEFHFPYQPYQTQLDFMKKVFETIENGKVGIFESPTGTGKSLTLLCASLTWLKLNDLRYDQAIEKLEQGKDVQFHLPLKFEQNSKVEPEWIRKHRMKSGIKDKLREKSDSLSKLEDIKQKEILELKIYDRTENQQMFKTKRFKPNLKEIKKKQDEDDDLNYLLDEYNDIKSNGLKDQVKSLLNELEGLEDLNKFNSYKNSNEVEPNLIKIYFASRTHSQLSQLLKELNKTNLISDQIINENEFGKVVTLTLGSRSNLCINKELKDKSKGSDHLNELCLELQDTKSKNKCEYYLMKDRPLLSKFKHQAINKLNDIEELINHGKSLNCCPFYSSRKLINLAKLICLPYNLLINHDARESIGIDLKDSIIIIDEAHNLLDSIESNYSPILTHYQIKLTHSQIQLYLNKYRNRLLGMNIMYLNQILDILKQLDLYLIRNQSNQNQLHIDSNNLLNELNLDMINLLKVIEYLKKSKLNNKLNGFIQSNLNNQNNSDKVQLRLVINFLQCLTEPSNFGKLIIETLPNLRIRYILLDSSKKFEPIVELAKSVILAGGTLSPLNTFINSVIPTIPFDDIITFQCNHVIPSTSLKCLTLNTSPTNHLPLTFNHQTSDDIMALDDIFHILMRLAPRIKDGMVIFFSSYKYLDKFINRIKPIKNQLERFKKIFVEPKSKLELDKVLNEYQNWIESKILERKSKSSINVNNNNNIGYNGAILFCVIGGKLSEGINFSDHLGRFIMVIGLPFPNLYNIDLKLKMEFLDLDYKVIDKVKPSKEYYEDLCMRAVNQSIGRAIRHINDYALILLLDSRYSNSNIIQKLPNWIQPSLSHLQSIQSIEKEVDQFFNKFLN